jgi:hypothetical protein
MTMERTPGNFFRDFQKAAEGRETLSQAHYQRKILKTYFPGLIEDLKDIWTAPNPLGLVKDEVPTILAEQLQIENIKLKPSQALLKLPSTEVWKKYMEYLDASEGKTILVYPVEKLGNWVLHNLGPSPCNGIKKQVNLFYYGDDGVNLMSLPLKTFTQERSLK